MYAITASFADPTTVGEPITVTASVTADANVPNALVELDIYDAAGKRLSQNVFKQVALGTSPTTLSFTFTATVPGVYHVRGGVFSTDWQQLLFWENNGGAVTVSAAGALPQYPKILVNAAGAATGTWLGDQGFTGGTIAAPVSGTVVTEGVTGAAPQPVYRTERHGTSFSYTASGLRTGQQYTVRLHEAETYWRSPGQRVFSVASGGTVLAAGL